MRRYLIALLTFLIAFGIASATYKLLDSFIDENINSLIHRLILLTFAIAFMIFFKVGLKQTNKLSKLEPIDFFVIGLILVLFGLNNILAKQSGTEFFYETILGLTFLKLTINSIAEELIYRGFIQTYIDEGQTKYKFMVSYGNLFATILMTLTHVGFYLIMTPLFATTSIILVMLFSLIAGHLRDKTNGLILPILLHLTVNYLHLFIQTNQ
jgi:membrane protease YdiL (CAAX protease family)